MEKTEVVAKIIEYVGGKDNVVNTWHCMTRLRFELKDTSKIQEDAIKALDGVIGVQFAKGQLQIVLGTSVHKYYDIALQMLDLKEDIAAPAQPEKKKDFISWFMDMVSGVFGPIVPAIAGAGMIKGLMGGLVALGVVSNATDTYKIIDMLASGVFTFLPFFIAASAAKKFKTNQYLAIAIAATLMYPTMVDAAKAGEISNFMFAGILPIPVFNYSGSVIPIIFGVFALSYIYKWVDNIVPEAARTVITPTITLFISGFFALTVIGPAGIYIGKGLAWMLDVLFGISPIFAGVVMGLIRPASILVGMHHAMTPIALENFQRLRHAHAHDVHCKSVHCGCRRRLLFQRKEPKGTFHRSVLRSVRHSGHHRACSVRRADQVQEGFPCCHHRQLRGQCLHRCLWCAPVRLHHLQHFQHSRLYRTLLHLRRHRLGHCLWLILCSELPVRGQNGPQLIAFSNLPR